MQILKFKTYAKEFSQCWHIPDNMDAFTFSQAIFYAVCVCNAYIQVIWKEIFKKHAK